MNFSNQIHPAITETARSRVYGWMIRNYQRHLAADGSVDVESLAEQAAYEFGISKEDAAELAAEAKTAVDGDTDGD